MKIAVCDDEVINGMVLSKISKEYCRDAKVDIFTAGVELLASSKVVRYDIVFLDIEIGEESGIEIGKKLKEHNPRVILIFISGFFIYFREMAECEPFAFIEKPIEKEEVFKNLDRAFQRLEKIRNKIFAFEFKGEKYNINLEEVLYFESQLRVIIIHMVNRELRFYGKLDDVQKEIQDITDMFARANKSCYVNLKKIEKYTRSNVMIGREKIPVSRKYVEEFSRRISEFY